MSRLVQPSGARNLNSAGRRCSGNHARSSYNDRMEPSFDHMTPAERIRYVQDLWDRIAPEADQTPITPAQAAEIDSRVADYRAHPETSIPWEVAREQMRRRL